MAYEKIQSLECDITTALGGINKKTGKKNPTSVEGYYLGSYEFDSKLSKTGKAWVHVFQTDTGNTGIYGKTNLDRKMKSAEIGTMTLVTQKGMQETKNAPMYLYEVAQDRANAISVNVGLTAPSRDAEDDVSTTFNDNSDAADDIDDSDDLDDAPADEVAPVRATAPKRAAAAPDAASRARVQALLNKGRNNKVA